MRCGKSCRIPRASNLAVSNPAMLRGMSGTGGADLAPSNPLALPGSSIAGPGSVSISSGMFHGILPPIPNLQFGYLYSFGNGLKSGRGTVDYLRPFSVGKDSVFFGEAHSEFQSFWNTSSFNNRVDVSLGGGARTLLHKSTLLGMNGFTIPVGWVGRGIHREASGFRWPRLSEATMMP